MTTWANLVEIETAFKEESNARKSEIYEIYSTFVQKQLLYGKDQKLEQMQNQAKENA